NVGIGTTNPMAKLHIVEPSNGGDTLILDSPDKPNIEFAYNGAKNYTITYAPSADSTFRDGINIGGGTNKSILNISTRNGGTVLVNGNSVQTSDLRLKKNISSIGQTLGKLLLLNGVLYNWKTEQDGSAKHAGVIAQEVEKVFPELVSTDSTGIKSVDYNGMVAPLIESIKEQQAQINELKQQVKDLESRLK
ncbi:MAG: tail fiber domain-containing protein, partial [Patescibacteria group bacterium]